MVSDHIAATQRMYSDFLGGSLARNALAPVASDVFEPLPPRCRQDLRQRPGRTTWCILFHPMMHFHNFQIEMLAQNFRRLAREPKQRIHSRRKI